MASSSSSSKTTRRPAGKGRRKIEIKKVEQTNKRLVTFSKRKLGLFRKAAELSLLSDSQIAVIVFSQFSKVLSQWLIDLQPPPVTMAESMYISLLDEDDMSEFDRQWESWNASNGT